MATYQFDVGHAQRWGLNEAVFLHNLIYWLRKNKAEGRHQHADANGIVRTWSYSDNEALVTLYPFWTGEQIRHVIKKLKTKNVIMTGHHSKNGFDRTLWFALVDESLLELPGAPPAPPEPDEEDPPFGKNPKSKREKSQMDSGDDPDGSGKNPDSLKETNPQPTLATADSNPLNVNQGQEEPPAPQHQDTRKTDNGGESEIYKREVLDPVEAVIELVGDRKSYLRWLQLREICVREPGGFEAWSEAITSTRQRMTRPGLGSAGAYLHVALMREMDKQGIVIPAGSTEEREEVRGAIGASLGLGE